MGSKSLVHVTGSFYQYIVLIKLFHHHYIFESCLWYKSTKCFQHSIHLVSAAESVQNVRVGNDRNLDSLPINIPKGLFPSPRVKIIIFQHFQLYLVLLAKNL